MHRRSGRIRFRRTATCAAAFAMTLLGGTEPWDAAWAAQPTFTTQRVITTNAGLAMDVRTADVDGDGDTDILLASHDEGIEWYENDGGSPPPGSWTRHEVSSATDGAFSVSPAGWTGTATWTSSPSFNDDLIAWYENTGGPSPWTRRPISFDARQAFDVWAADLDRDGDTEVISASGFDNKVAWYESDGASPPSYPWTMRVLSTTDWDARSVQAADLDVDGDLDIVSGSGGKVAWYESRGWQLTGTPGFGNRMSGTLDETHFELSDSGNSWRRMPITRARSSGTSRVAVSHTIGHETPKYS